MKARDRMVLTSLGLIGLLAAMWFLVLAPKREEVSALQVKIEQSQARRDAAMQRAVTAEQARASYDRDYATVARLGKAVPPQADVPSLVFQLESAARRANVDFRGVAITDDPAQAAATVPTTAGIEPTPFSFTFEGSYGGLRRLLAAVDRFSLVKGTQVAVSGRLLTLDSVRMSPGRAGLPEVKADITAKAYIAPVPDALPATGTPAPVPTTTTTTTTATQETK